MTVTITSPLDDVVAGTMTALNDAIGAPSMGSVTCVGFQIGGTFVGTVVFEGTMDSGATWQTLSGVNTAGTVVPSLTAPGSVIVPSGGFQACRARVSAYTSGTIQINAVVNEGWVGGGAVSINGTVPVTISTGGVSHTLNSAATTNATLVKAAGGNLLSLNVSNVSASPRFFKLYAKASAPTVGTDVPILVIPIAANSVQALPLGPEGVRINGGIAYAITGAAVDSDTTAIAAGDCKVLLNYL